MKFRAAFLLVVLYFVVVFVAVIIFSGGDEEDQEEVLSDDEIEKMLEFVEDANAEQRVYNKEVFGEEIELVIVVQVHHRPNYLLHLLTTLEKTPQINTTLLIFSHDMINEEINKIIFNIKFTKFMQILYPLSVQTHPYTFPGPDYRNRTALTTTDSFGHPRKPKLAQIKHHWWWKANFIFREIKTLSGYSGFFLFLEEDHIVAPDFLHCLEKMVEMSGLCPSCRFFSLGIGNRAQFHFYPDKVMFRIDFENLGLAFNRSVWNEISENREVFCKFDDYNWDWSLKFLYRQLSIEKSSMVLSAGRVFHIGVCGTHGRKKNCDATIFVHNYERAQVNLFPETLVVSPGFEIMEVKKIVNNGGWGDPRDQDLCLRM